MVRQQFDDLFTAVRREADDITSTLKDAATSVRDTLKDGSIKNVPKRINEPSGLDPIKFRKLLITLIKLLIIFEFLSAILEGMGTDSWGRLGKDCVIAGIVYIMWDRIKTLVLQKKDEYRRKMEYSGETIKLVDALIFSLLWSDEIYTDIPLDMRRLVVIAYTLIAISIGAIFLGIGQGLVGLILCSSLILAAVNLLAWVVSRERGEKESLKTELKLAHDVQVSLMPKEHPRVKGFDIAGLSIPAQEVGGDHFDYAPIGGDSSKFCISVFDVSGKGMQAAMSAVFTSGAFASEVKLSSSAAEILTRLNNAVYTHSKRGHFVAFLLAALDVESKTLTFANAGQMKPLLKSNGSVQWLNSVGVNFPLGMKEDSAYGEQAVRLTSGDVLLLLTDGFTEAMNSSKEQFGTERMESFLHRLDADQTSSQKILERVTFEIERHVNGTAQHDDMTMVVVRVL
jgi:serine phosphatase RsbU (regulator of sigma subunit)